MQLYLAPMEEITGYIFRNTLDKHFGGVDCYYTPFISPNQKKILKTRDGREIIPEHNAGLNVVPQIMGNEPEYFMELVSFLVELGYEEINLNCGCPSGTVVKKKRGSALLKETDILDKLLNSFYDSEVSSRIKMSVKTRVGFDDEEDFEEALKIYNKYPIHELIIHPRIQKDFYNGKPRMNMFEYGLHNSKAPVSYNGDIYSVGDYRAIVDAYGESESGPTNLKGIMIGRGAVMNPGIFREIKTGVKMTVDVLHEFHDDLYETYASEYSEKDGLYKMKEVWTYMSRCFADIDKPLKAVRKCNSRVELMTATREIWKSDFILY